MGPRLHELPQEWWVSHAASSKRQCGLCLTWLPACLYQLELCPCSCSSAEIGWQCHGRIDGFARAGLVHLASQHGIAASLLLALSPSLCLGGLLLETHRVLYG